MDLDFFDVYFESTDYVDEGAQQTYYDLTSRCRSTSNFGAFVSHGLICRPEDWNLIPLSNSTLWSPNRREFTASKHSIDILNNMDIAFADMIQLRNSLSRRFLPPALEAVTLRNVGGTINGERHEYGFGNLDLIIEGNSLGTDLSNELSGLYDVAYTITDVGDIEDTDFGEIYRLEMDILSERDLDKCGPPDSPHPCIGRFIRPNTDVTMTDRYGMPLENYAPLQTSRNGVGKPIEMGRDFSGDGTLPTHGYGNTFDIRLAYPVPPAGEEYGDFDDLSYRTQRVHHTGKKVYEKEQG